MILLVASLVLAVIGIVVLLAVVLSSHSATVPPRPNVTTTAASSTQDTGTKLPMPSWAATSQNTDANTKTVATWNSSRSAPDFVLYGDSITERISKYTKTWAKYFGNVKAVPLGIGGNKTTQLMWRMGTGKEKFLIDPKVIALLIGINDLNWLHESPVQRLEYIVRWMKGAYPTSKLVIVGLLPCTRVDVTSTNEGYRQIASKYGVTYTACGLAVDANNKKLSQDGTHPTEAGYDKLFACLQPVVLAQLSSP